MRRCVYLGRKWCAVIEPGMRSCTHGYNCYTNISVHWFIRIMLLNPALYTSDLMLCVSVCWGLLQSDWGFWCMERANKAARKCHYVCVFNVYYSRMSCGRKSMQWEHSSYQFLISLSLRKHTVTHNEKKHWRKQDVSPCLTVLWGLCTQKQWYHLNPGRLFYWGGPFWKTKWEIIWTNISYIRILYAVFSYT